MNKMLPILALLLIGAWGLQARETAVPVNPSGPYFGQQPPGLKPGVFAPGIVSLSDRYEYVIAFSPDGTESCFGVTDDTWSTCDLYCSKQVQGVWSTPAKAAFQGDGDGWLPFFSPDGRWIYFSSGRPDILKDANAWMSHRTEEGWSEPVRLPAPLNSTSYDWRPNLTSAGVMYFSSSRPGGVGDMDIYRSVPADGAYTRVEDLPAPLNSPALDASPSISSDERFMTLGSWRPGGYGKGDLYIAYRRGDGSWTTPQNLGPEINTAWIEDGGALSPDGKYFFFNRREDWETKKQTDILWVDVRAIFKPYVLNPAGEKEVEARERFVLRLPADQFADYDDGTLALSASSGGGAPLYGWLVFDPATRTLSGTPPAEGTFTIEIRATDAIGSACADVVTIRAR